MSMEDSFKERTKGPEHTDRVHAMALAGKYYRDRAIAQNDQRFNKYADMEEEQAGVDYDVNMARKEEDRQIQAEREARRKVETNKPIDEIKDAPPSESKQEAQESPNEGIATIPEGFRVDELTEAGAGLAGAFREREGDNLSTLIEPHEISRLMAGVRDLEDAVLSKQIEGVESSLEGIYRAIYGIGRAESPPMLNENDESFAKIMYFLKNLQDACLMVGSRARERESLSRQIHILNQLVEEKLNFVGMRRRLLQSYLERRY